MMQHLKTAVVAGGLMVLLAGCSVFDGDWFPNYDGSARGAFGTGDATPSVPTDRELAPCRGDAMLPAVGMTLVLRGGQIPAEGRFVREERLIAPYRILPPGARMTMDYIENRLNIEVDRRYVITGLRCG